MEEWERGEKLRKISGGMGKGKKFSGGMGRMRKIPSFTFPSPKCLVKPCEY